MKNKTDRFIMALSEPLEWAERGIDYVFVKTEQIKNRILKKSRKRNKNQLSKKDLIQKGKDQDLGALVANYKAKKRLLKDTKPQRERLQELAVKQADKQQEQTI